jgi:hypothetical protein
MFLIIYYIVFCITCITLFNCGYFLYIWIDHTELESENQAEQVQWVFGGPQASSCDDANIVVIKTNLSAFNHASSLLI